VLFSYLSPWNSLLEKLGPRLEKLFLEKLGPRLEKYGLRPNPIRIPSKEPTRNNHFQTSMFPSSRPPSNNHGGSGNRHVRKTKETWLIDGQ
jgi:hypothetical protein